MATFNIDDATPTSPVLGTDRIAAGRSTTPIAITVADALALVTNDTLHVAGSSVASASTVNLSTVTADYIHITGTTTITAFTSQTAGNERTVVFDGALTLTHNATSLILPGGASITTAAGDRAILRSEGGGNWRVIDYVPASGKSVIPPAVGDVTGLGTDVSTALAINVGSAGAFVPFNGAGGTPSSLTLTNATGLPVVGGGTGGTTGLTVQQALNPDTTLTDGATVTIAVATSTRSKVTIAGNRTFAVTGDSDGCQFGVTVTQDGTGTRTITWFSGITWMEGSGSGAPDLTAGAVTSYAFRRISSGVYQGWRSRANGDTFTPGGSNTQIQFNNSGAFGGSSSLTWSGTVLGVSGNLSLGTAGNGIAIKEGSNACMGVATLVGGTVTVSTTKVTANSRIFLTGQNLGTITVPVGYAVSARSAGTSFTILSANVVDTSSVAWEIKEPA